MPEESQDRNGQEGVVAEVIVAIRQDVWNQTDLRPIAGLRAEERVVVQWPDPCDIEAMSATLGRHVPFYQRPHPAVVVAGDANRQPLTEGACARFHCRVLD